MHITCTNCSAEWCWACGQTGKRGQVHHVYACTRAPDASWAFQKEQARVLDGSFAAAFDAAAYRAELAELLAPSGDTPPPPLAAAAGRGLPDGLRPTLRCAMELLQWAHVFTYFNVHRGASASAVPPLVRLALAQVERHSDVLLALAEPAVGGGSGEEASEASPSSGVADGVVDDVPDRLSWLVTCMLYLRSNLKQAPPAAPGGPSSSR